MNIISSVLQQEVQELNKTATIYGINGPVIYLKGDTGFMMSEMVYVGKEKLVGEVISLDKDITTVQVYEETSGLKPGEIVEASGSPVSVTLAPGILNNIFDGIERPLEQIAYPHHRGQRRLPSWRRYYSGGSGDQCDRTQMYGSAGCGR